MDNARIAHYEITGRIGAGAMGEVYHGRDTKLDREVAIKILPAALSGKRESLVRFEREARLLATLHHPHIATVFGIEDLEGSKAIVLELVEGETLKERLQRGPLSLPEALEVFRQIASALEAAHEKGIIHRDLKPANIKFSAGGEVKLLDFGIAKAIETARDEVSEAVDTEAATIPAETTMPGAVLGTPAYMSPEQTRGLAVDRRTDVWAFGCCLFEALTGRKPFDADTVSDLMAEILKSEPDFKLVPLETPSEILSLLRRCLEKEPRRRLRDLGDIAIRLEETGEPTRLPAVQGSRAPERSSRRGLRPIVVALLLVVAVGLGFLLSTVLLREQAPSSPTIRSLTVVPFENLTNDPAEALRGRLLAEQVEDSLEKIGDLKVRTASAGSHSDIPAFARDHQVDGVVTGSVTKIGDQFEVRAKLLDAEGVLTWSKRFGPGEFFDLRNRIAIAIASVVEVRVIDEERDRMEADPKVDFEAWKLYQQAITEYHEQTVEGRRKARELLIEALELDSGYGDAAALLTVGPWVESIWGGTTQTPQGSLEESRRLAAKYRPNLRNRERLLLPEAWATAYGDRNWTEARRLFREFCEKFPNIPVGHTSYGEFLAYIEANYDEAHRRVDRALDREPNSTGHLSDKALIHAAAGEYREAVELFNRTIALQPDHWNAVGEKSLCQLALAGGDQRAIAEAVASARKAVALSHSHPRSRVFLSRVLARTGKAEDRKEAESLYAGLLRDTRDHDPPLYFDEGWLALAAYELGREAEAFDLFEQAARGKGRWSIYNLRCADNIQLMGEDPRFWELVAQLDLPALPLGHRYRELEQKMRFGDTANSQTLGIRSLVILPFKNLSSDPSEALRGELIAEQIGATLNSIRELTIRSGGARASEAVEFGALARELEVDGVIHGSFSKVGERFEAYATLYARDGTVRWWKNFEPEEFIVLRNNLALAIAEEVEVEVLDQERREMLTLRDIDFEAYQEFRKGLAALEIYTPEGIADGIRHLRTASKIDPNFLEAKIWEAPCHWVPTEFGGAMGTPREQFVRPREILAEAEAIAPDASMVLSFGGWLAMAADWEWETAVTKARLALEANPKEVDALRLRSRFRSYIEGRPDSALDALEKAMTLDSRFYLRTELAEIHLWRGDYQRALEQTRSNIEENPADPAPHLTASVCHRNLGDFEAAAKAATKAIEMMEGNPTAEARLAEAYAAQGQVELARGLLAGLEEPVRGRYVPSAAIASGYAVLGDTAKAVEWLQKGVDNEEGFSMIKIRSDDWLKLLGDQPGYWDIIDQMDFPPLPIGHSFREQEEKLRPWRGRGN